MDFQDYKKLVGKLKIGKKLPDAIYLHKSALTEVDSTLLSLTTRIASALKIEPVDWNIVKYYRSDFKIALLNYPSFDDYAYPALSKSHTIDLNKLSLRAASYIESKNPPILHRKETFLAPGDERIERFSQHTLEGEKIGLYENTKTIGFKQHWERLIKKKSHYLDEKGHLHPLTEKPIQQSEYDDSVEIERHKTAITRDQLSQPMQILARHEYLNGDYSVFDYGCGQGDDLRELEAHGIDAIGWDPVHAPEVDPTPANIVNLGFVLNVIEDRAERDDTLRKAHKLAEQMLIVSVMVAGESVISQFRPYKDGVITSRNTFQKYYAQSEIRYYIEHTLGQNSVPVGQGIFIVFKDKTEEQRFLLERQFIHRSWQQKTQRIVIKQDKPIAKDLIQNDQALFDDFWETCLDLGRVPANDEFEFSDQIRRVAGSHAKAHSALIDHYGDELFQEAQSKRKDDLLVYFALSLFEKRQTQTKMPNSLKRDIKAFFRNHASAICESKELLFSVGNNEVIEQACISAYEQFKCGEFNDGHSYIFVKELLNEAPKELRVYVGCAVQLYGDLEGIQLIKAHMRSGKVTLLGYKNWETDTPLLIERIKIKMREQDVDFFDYVGEYKPVPLENRSMF
ncbi:DNA phosphorothioation-associated putative methyltransferase [Alkalimarinus alittae]|uniref:DNA phosphorothioation-associated putative methyltransferase n=1 Tax=Alkalimarinus alittae TaxID=2961619 RepID=A0ABY6N3X4_9ALTE|nr:DNA phosphorothioation-associated putative methyltransferase [Alkalimarinus alittae]UZE96823.1 DNA phosphorothioation-associated putative methyltransferase [Alkalimarinus alittae]